MSISKYYIPFVFLTLLSCGEFEEKSSSMDDTPEVSVDQNQNINIELENTIFSIPSPLQIAMELSDSNSSFLSALLHDADQYEKYSSSFDKAMMLGIYGTDLAYCSVNELSGKSITYFSTMKKLADKLNIGFAINESLVERFSANIDDRDSVLVMASEAYVKIDEYLKENDNQDIATMVLMGGWIESMYIQSTALQSDTSEVNQLKLAHHKYALNHFITLLEKVGTGDRYWELQSMLGDVKKLYDEIPTTYEFKPSTTEATTQTTQINSTSSFDTDYGTMLEISNEFINLRNYYTK